MRLRKPKHLKCRLYSFTIKVLLKAHLERNMAAPNSDGNEEHVMVPIIVSLISWQIKMNRPLGPVNLVQNKQTNKQTNKCRYI